MLSGKLSQPTIGANAMFTFKFPHKLITPSNPAFATGLERIRLLRTSRSLILYTLFVIFIPLSILMFWWLLTAITYAQAQRLQQWEIYTNFQNIETALALMLLFITPISALALDIYTISVAVNSIGSEMQTLQWNMRLAHPNPTAYLTAQYVLAQVRAWRALALEVAVRIFGVCLVLTAFMVTDNCFIGDNPPMSGTCGVSFLPLHMDMLMIILSCLVAGFGVLYAMEPLWRMRVLAAIGLLISARIRKPALVRLAAFTTILGVHLVQLIMIVVVFQCFQITPNPVIDTGVVVVAIVLFVFLYRKAHNTALTVMDRM